MTRSEWIKHIEPYLEPASDPVLAAAGVQQPKPAFRLSFLLPYASVTAFPDNYVNLADETCLMILVAEYGQEVVHKVGWGNIGTVSIQFEERSRTQAQDLSRQIIMRKM